MRFDLEEKFVNNYINRSYRNRLLFELKSSKKRLDAIMRFSHNIDSLIKIETIHLKLKKFDACELKSFLINQKLYVVSFKFLDGIMMDTNELLAYIQDDYPILICGNDIAIIKKEFEKGEDNFYLLKKREK